jgi:hypothetical protein
MATPMQQAAIRRMARRKAKRDPDDLGPKPDYSDEALESEAMKPMPAEYRGRPSTPAEKASEALKLAAKRRAQRRNAR